MNFINLSTSEKIRYTYMSLKQKYVYIKWVQFNYRSLIFLLNEIARQNF